MGRLLGIDHGTQRIGLALSDPSGLLARPWDVLGSEGELFERLPEMLQEQGIAGIVVGLPLNMDGSEGPRALAVRAFIGRLEARLQALALAEQVAVEAWDERLTTVQAENVLRTAGFRGRKRKARVDKVAAQILLQSFLDRNEKRL